MTRAEAPGAETVGRRPRSLDGGDELIVAAIAGKVLHGWLQNRHQTLFPLTVNLRTLDDAARRTVSDMMAVALLAGPDGSTDHHVARASVWLASVGADAPALAAMAAAHTAPPALSTVIADVLRHGLSAYAYVAALVALPLHDATTAHFLDYLAARLNLPTAMVRSAHRRYRPQVMRPRSARGGRSATLRRPPAAAVRRLPV